MVSYKVLLQLVISKGNSQCDAHQVSSRNCKPRKCLRLTRDLYHIPQPLIRLSHLVIYPTRLVALRGKIQISNSIQQSEQTPLALLCTRYGISKTWKNKILCPQNVYNLSKDFYS